MQKLSWKQVLTIALGSAAFGLLMAFSQIAHNFWYRLLFASLGGAVLGGILILIQVYRRRS